MSKQTAVEWLFAHLLPFLSFSDAKEREYFRKCLEEAKAMDKEQMEEIREMLVQGALTNMSCASAVVEFDILTKQQKQ
jgi:hypothetical protein